MLYGDRCSRGRSRGVRFRFPDLLNQNLLEPRKVAGNSPV